MYLGIDLGGTNIAVGLVDENAKLIAKSSVPTGREREADEIIADMANLCRKVTEDAGYKMEQIKSIGIGSPGAPDVIEKRILYVNNIKSFVDVPIEKKLREHFPGMNVYLENDANAAAFGEIIGGAAKNVDSAVVITLGTGVGSGVIIGNKIYSGFNHAAAELGHMVIEIEGLECSCGRRGCFEKYASATALIEQTKEMMKKCPDSKLWEVAKNIDDVNAKVPFDAAQMGDKAAGEVISNYIKYLGIGVCNVINIFQPELIVIGGGVSYQGENLLVPLREYADKFAYNPKSVKPKIVAATLGNDAGIVGAAMLFSQQ